MRTCPSWNRKVRVASTLQAARSPWRSWRVIIMRSKGEHLGTVEAPDRERAETVAIKQFDLDRDQRRRLLVSERD